MSCIIRCHTLFDITRTGVLNRRIPSNLTEREVIDLQQRRNRQVNFDTVIQIISLRSLPEEISNITVNKINFEEFQKYGFLFDNEEDQLSYSFTFSIPFKGVFDNGIEDLGSLYSDCSQVPMLKVGTEWDKLPLHLDTTPELKNIHFEVLVNE